MTSKPWYSNGLRFECKRTGNCCKTHGQYEFVYLASGDVEAIANYRGLTQVEFLDKYCAKDDGYTILRIDEPACPFLNSENGCEIYPVRPKQCATWPFWHENLKDPETWNGPVKDCCAGIGQGPLHSQAFIERTAQETEDWYEGED